MSIQQNSKTPLLDKVIYPKDLKSFSLVQLKQLADELRYEIIDAVSKTGGHLGAGLGVIELTVALHYAFNTPDDKIIWDVGHQTYPHKVITGRRDKIRTIRQAGGLSPFTKIKESEYDVFGAGHSSTSISAAIGIAVARDMSDKSHEVIPIIGDGAMSAGMAFEALNNADQVRGKLIIILNDNDMSISPPVGAISKYLKRIISSNSYISFREIAKKVINPLPEIIKDTIKKAEKTARYTIAGSTIFDNMGIEYIGPIDGHNLEEIIKLFENVRDSNYFNNKKILIHLITKKGYGYKPAEESADKYHGVVQFDVESGKQQKTTSTIPSYTEVFAKNMIERMKEDNKIIAITAAMDSGTGLDKIVKIFPDKVFDVGIAEQHAVTFAGGLALSGYKPVVAIYSTFLQRAYDQIVHDIAIQKLPVRFAIDRAGYVGADGPTHAGSFDIAFLSNLPNFVVMAASDEEELIKMINTSININDRPSSFRYPRGSTTGITIDYNKDYGVLEIGKSRIIKEGSKVAIISLGDRLKTAIKVADKLLEENKIYATIIDARFVKPFDTEMLTRIANTHDIIISIEAGSIGGMACHISDFLCKNGLIGGGKSLKFIPIYMADKFIEHNHNAEEMYDEAEMGVEMVIEKIRKVIV